MWSTKNTTENMHFKQTYDNEWQERQCSHFIMILLAACSMQQDVLRNNKKQKLKTVYSVKEKKLIAEKCSLMHSITNKNCVTLATMNDLDIHSRSSQLLLLYGRMAYHFLLSRTIFRTLPLLNWTRLPVTLRTPSFLTKKLKLQTTWPF